MENISEEYENSSLIMLTENDDNYSNTLAGATIQALGGNDDIYNTGKNLTIDGGAGDDSIDNEGFNVWRRR